MDQQASFHQAHDALFRAAFGVPERAAHLLRCALPGDVAAAVDWTSLQLVEGTFVDTELRRQQSDLLFACRVAERAALLYLLLEHKAANDHFAALQLLRYVVRIWERHRSEQPDERRLPPVLPFVLHHGGSGWTSPRSVHELIDLAGLPTSLAGLQPQCTFVIEDLGALQEADLRQRFADPASLLVLLHLQQLRRVPQTAELLLTWRELIQHVADDPATPHLLDQLVSYVSAVSDDDPRALRAAYTDIHHRAERSHMSIADKLRQEGRIEGRVEGLRTALQLQLEARFGPLSPTIAAQLAVAADTDLERWLHRVLASASIDEVFEAT